MTSTSHTDTDSSGISTLYEERLPPAAEPRRMSRRLQGQPPIPIERPEPINASAAPAQHPGTVNPPERDIQGFQQQPQGQANHPYPPVAHEHQGFPPIIQHDRYEHQPAQMPVQIHEVPAQAMPPVNEVNMGHNLPRPHFPNQVQFPPPLPAARHSHSTGSSHRTSHDSFTSGGDPMDHYHDNSLPNKLCCRVSCS